MMRSEFHLCVLPEQLPRKFGKRPLQVRKGDMLIDHQPLDLMEGRGMGRVHLVGTEYPARRDHADWQFPLLHLMHLRGGRLRPQQDIPGNIKGVLLILCRMIRRNIERLKVIIIFFHIGAFHYLIAHTDEDSLHLFQCDGIGMAVPHLILFGGQGHVYDLRL